MLTFIRDLCMGSLLIGISLYVILSVVREVLTDLWVAEHDGLQSDWMISGSGSREMSHSRSSRRSME